MTNKHIGSSFDDFLEEGILAEANAVAIKRVIAWQIQQKIENEHLSKTKMDTLSYSAFKANLASTLDKVNDDHKPVLITRKGHKPTVLMSLEDFQAYQETAYLMASPKNASRLNAAIAEVEAGRTQTRERIEK